MLLIYHGWLCNTISFHNYEGISSLIRSYWIWVEMVRTWLTTVNSIDSYYQLKLKHFYSIPPIKFSGDYNFKSRVVFSRENSPNNIRGLRINGVWKTSLTDANFVICSFVGIDYKCTKKSVCSERFRPKVGINRDAILLDER